MAHWLLCEYSLSQSIQMYNLYNGFTKQGAHILHKEYQL